MTKSARLHVRMRPEVKDRADALFDSLGLTMSDAVTLFVYESLRAGRLPFNVESIPPDVRTAKNFQSYSDQEKRN